MSGTVVRSIHRADPAVVAALERLGVATVHEAQGRPGLMQPYMRPLWRGARNAGSAVTALCHPGDNWMIHVAVQVLTPGGVLLVPCSSESDTKRYVDAVTWLSVEERSRIFEGNARTVYPRWTAPRSGL